MSGDVTIRRREEVVGEDERDPVFDVTAAHVHEMLRVAGDRLDLGAGGRIESDDND